MQEEEQGQNNEHQSIANKYDFEKSSMGMRYKFIHLAKTLPNIVDLGQGFPDWDPPRFLKESIMKSFSNDAFYQYTRNHGLIKLVESVARNYEKTFERKLNPMTEIVIGAGAGNVLYLAFKVLLNPGDEVILLEPFFDNYTPMIEFPGGKIVGVPMLPPKTRPKKDFQNIKDLKDEWTIDFDSLEKVFTKKTKVLLLNTPQNPTGKILSFEELKRVKKILDKFPKVVLIMDEVYEFQIGTQYRELPRMATLPGMWDKTITIFSAGKVFSATGLRIGWGIGPNWIIRQIMCAFQYSSYCIAEPMQTTVADCLDALNTPYDGQETYKRWVATYFEKHRNYLLEKLATIKNFDVDFFCPEGGYFIIADISKQNPETKYILPGDDNNVSYRKDAKFLLNLCHDSKIVCLPCSNFYTDEHKHLGENFIRFSYTKDSKTIDQAAEILNKSKSKF